MRGWLDERSDDYRCIASLGTEAPVRPESLPVARCSNRLASVWGLAKNKRVGPPPPPRYQSTQTSPNISGDF